jgi:long-chain fatty acid transport protein
MRACIRRAAAGALTAASILPAGAMAQGFGVYEQGACVMGRAGTGVARPCADGSTIFFNPANLAATPDVLSVGLTGIAPRGSFTNDLTGIQGDLADKVYPVPNLYLVKGLSPGAGSRIDRVALGVGVFAPFGLTTEWPTTFEGRFLGYKTVIRAIYVQPTAAVRLLGRVSVGAGMDVNFAHVQLRQRVDLSTQTAAPGVTFADIGIPTGTDFADANLSANATRVGFHVGASATVTHGLDVGVRYMSRQTVHFDNGTVEISQVPTGLVIPATLPGIPAGTPVDVLVAPQFAPGGPLTNQSATALVRLPDQLVFGLAYAPVERVRLLADAQWSHWAVFDRVPITFEKLPPETLRQDNRNVWDLRFGGEYDASRSLTLRGGWYTHRGAEPDYAVIPNLPEGGRSSFTLGVGTRLGAGVRLDAAYQYIDQADRRGRTVPLDTTVTPFTAQNNGLYKFHAHLFGATFSYAF